MNQRLVASCLALPLVAALLVYAGFSKLPYARYMPGTTINVLGTDDRNAEIIQVQGHRVYRDDGQLRMTTVSVSSPQPEGERGLGLFELMRTWFDRDDAVLPYLAVHPDDETVESSRQEGAVQMSTSQDAAVEVALSEMGIDVPLVLQVAAISPGQPAAKVLEVGDRLLAVNGTPLATESGKRPDVRLRELVGETPTGGSLELRIERADVKKTVSITPVTSEGRQVIGVTPGYDYDFPFRVGINISTDIGGPSAGLMFSLAVYDTLTPGSLTGGRSVAGTGEIAADGTVGAIGGIQQKIAGAREAGADLFIVPADNCADIDGARNGDMRLMMGTTMHDVRLALDAYAADPDADLPTCEDAP